MKNLALILGIAFISFLFSCSSRNQDDSTQNDSTQTTVAGDTLAETEAQFIDDSPVYHEKNEPTKTDMSKFSEDLSIDVKLKMMFTPNQIAFFEKVKKYYAEIKTPEQMEMFYTRTLDTVMVIIERQKQALTPSDYSADVENELYWTWFQEYMPYIQIALYCSECSVGPVKDIAPLLKKAQETESDIDDKFFDALADIFPHETNDEILVAAGNNFATYVMDGCDFCSYSTLGEGIMLKSLKKIQQLQSETNLFKSQLEYMFSMMLPTSTDNHYGVPKAKVINELEQIIKSIQLSEDNMQSVQKVLKDIKTKKDIQFNCKEDQCEYDTY